jgi:sigma-B regulation protein RsbU (phosphoserine phosphatase)
MPTGKIPLNRGLLGAAVRERRLIHAGDVRKDPRYVMVNPETRSEMAVPLIYKSNVIGVLDLEHTRVNYFNEDHERTLVTLASQIAIAIENARLYQRVVEQEHRLEQDLAMAREVQLRLLPPKVPRQKQASFATKFLPARTIGGDLYDFLRYDRQTTAVAMGDVSGKAAPAALFGALTSGIMRAAASQRPTPAEMLKVLNESLHERRVDSQYVTMVYAVWNDGERTLQIANAGSVQPLLCRAGEIEPILAEGFPLGLFKDITYEEFTLSLQPGDAVVFFSDGIADALNEKQELYGEERLIEVVRQRLQQPAQEIVDAIFHEVSLFQSGTERFDDETVVLLKVL